MKKILSLMLVLAMLLSLVPSFAEEGDAVIQENPEAAVRLLQQTGTPVLGCIINKARISPIEKSRYGYGSYGYRYEYRSGGADEGKARRFLRKLRGNRNP